MTRVKICGITRPEDALLATELGAAALGFVFWPGSPRYVDPERARDIAAVLPRSVVCVGVFVNQPLGHVQDVAGRVQLGAVQLHGDEPIAFIEAIMQPVIKSVPVTADLRPEALDLLPAAVTVLLDAHDPVKRGGTGRTVDWTLAAQAAARRQVMLSGGLTAGNVKEAIERVRPYAVDVSSGVERTPGIKDPDKLRALFAVIGSERAATR